MLNLYKNLKSEKIIKINCFSKKYFCSKKNDIFLILNKEKHYFYSDFYFSL